MNYHLRLLLLCLLILGTLFLAGCAGPTTLRELEDEAMRTGDWTEVEAREKRNAYDNAMRTGAASCGTGAVWVCVDLPPRKEIRYIKWYCGCYRSRGMMY